MEVPNSAFDAQEELNKMLVTLSHSNADPVSTSKGDVLTGSEEESRGTDLLVLFQDQGGLLRNFMRHLAGARCSGVLALVIQLSTKLQECT